jgi:hypothetical protein
MQLLSIFRGRQRLCSFCALALSSSIAIAADGPQIAWDETVNGDLSNDFAAPTMIKIDEPGEYIIRATTGPMVPVRLDKPRKMTGGDGQIQQMDANGDGLIQYSEATQNLYIHFETYDLNQDGAIEASERAYFTMGGDAHDTFNFLQQPGINLVAIKVTQYDSGGPRNDLTVLALMEHSSAGVTLEAGGVVITDNEAIKSAPSENIAAAVMADAEGGTEVYAQYDLWKTYRRNDDTIFWRIGEGQEKATSELVFVFE